MSLQNNFDLHITVSLINQMYPASRLIVFVSS
uniref:Uncharacterized protein n=1 Tax=Anguilla anguilla TaxID=7936 RepID=A0A0E9TNM8_ANGAN